MIQKIAITLFAFYIFFLYGIIFIKNVFIFELAISFLPYILFVNIVIFCVIIVFISKNKLLFYEKIQGSYEIHAIKIVLVLIFFTFLIIFLLKIVNFYLISNPTSLETGTKYQLKVIFFNKRFSNNNYDEISKAITEFQPDVLVLAESEPLLENKIQSLESFAFQDRSIGEQFFPITIYSKYNIVNSIYSNELDMLYNQLNVHGIMVDLISVHPAAPINQAVLNHRNKQLDHICAFTNSFSKKNKILVGDFNLSNWSPKYEEFISCLINLTNTAKGQGMNFTWSGKLFSRSPEFKTHIDHIFISNNLKLLNYEVLGNYSSDHNLVLVTIKL